MAQIIKRTARSGEFRYDVRTRIGGRVVTRTFKRRRDADDYATTVEADRIRGVALDPRHSRMTVKTVSERWLDANPDKRPSSYAVDESTLRVHVVSDLGKRGVGAITPADVQRLVNAWSKDHAPRTTRRLYGTLRAVFDYAVSNDWIARSPCRGMKLPRVTTTRRHELDPEDIAAIAGAMESEDAPIVWLGAVLGLRWSEIAGLRVGRLDLLEHSLTVAEAVTRGTKGRLYHGEPKTQAGKRTVPMPSALSAILAEHLAHRSLTAADGDALVFAASNGSPLHYSNWRHRVWGPACEKAGCKGAGFHDLRRANATMMVVEGVDMKTAQKRLGHADIRTTLGIYAQAVEEADRNAADTLGERFLGVSIPSDARDRRAMTRQSEGRELGRKSG